MAIRKIQIRRDTDANWQSENPILDQGELGLDLDTGRLKVGDGSTPWAGLGYLRTLWDTIDNIPTEFPPEYHEHPIEEIIGLQDSLDEKSNLDGGNTFTGAQEFEDTVEFKDDVSLDGDVYVGGILTLANQATLQTHAVRGDRRITADSGLEITHNGYLTHDLTVGISLRGVTTQHIENGAVTNDKIDTVAASKLTGATSVENGGTGRDTLTSGYFLLGDGTNPVEMRSPAEVLAYLDAPHMDAVVYLTGNQTIEGVKTFTDEMRLGSHVSKSTDNSDLTISGGENSTSGAAITLHGGARSSQPSGGSLVSNGTAMLRWSPSGGVTVSNQGTVPGQVLHAGRAVGTASGLTGGGPLTGDLTLRIADSGVREQHIFDGAVRDRHVNAVFGVGKGGTGHSNIPDGVFLTGSGTDQLSWLTPEEMADAIGLEDAAVLVSGDQEVEGTKTFLDALAIAGNTTERVVDMGAAGTSASIDISSGSIHVLTLDEPLCTLSFTNPPQGEDGKSFVLVLIHGDDGRDVVWPSGIMWPAGISPTLGASSGDYDIFTFMSVDGGSSWYGFGSGGGGGGGGEGSYQMDLGTISTSTFVNLERHTDVLGRVTLAGNVTLNFGGVSPTEPVTAATFVVRQDGTGGRQLTLGGNITYLNGSDGSIDPTPNSVSVISMITRDQGGTWQVSVADSRPTTLDPLYINPPTSGDIYVVMDSSSLVKIEDTIYKGTGSAAYSVSTDDGTTFSPITTNTQLDSGDILKITSTGVGDWFTFAIPREA